MGSNLVKAMVTAEDGATIKIYMVTVTRAAAGASDDAALSALTLSDANGSAIELTPQFDAAITNYTASIPFSVGQITASATRSHSGAWALVFGQDGTNAQNQRTLDVAVGANLIKVMVTAEDGATSKIYVVTATRAATASDDATLSALQLEGDGGATVDLTPAFDPATATYSAEVAHSVRSIDVTAVENYSTASAVIIEADGASTPDVATIDLDVGDNLVKAMVTAEDGTTVLIYPDYRDPSRRLVGDADRGRRQLVRAATHRVHAVGNRYRRGLRTEFRRGWIGVPRCWHHPLRRWALPERIQGASRRFHADHWRSGIRGQREFEAGNSGGGTLLVGGRRHGLG